MIPEHDDHPDPEPTPWTARRIYRLGSALSLAAGGICAGLFVLELVQEGTFQTFLLVLAAVLLLAPLLLRALLPTGH